MTSEEEQMKALQERLAKMSPEELQAFWKQRCVFCQLIDGKIESKKAYEDEKCTGIFDINPASPGHVLLLPKDHFMVGPQVPEKIMHHMGRVAKRISHCMLTQLKCKGTSIFIANGGPAGQQSQHFMIHIIPRYDEQDVPSLSIPKHSFDQEQLAQVAEHLRQYNEKKFGIEINAVAPSPEENKIVEEQMVKKHIKKESGYLYFVDKDGDIARLPMKAPKGTPQEKVIITELGPLDTPAKPKAPKKKKKAAKKVKKAIKKATEKKSTKKSSKKKKKEDEEQPSPLEEAIADEGESDLDRISRLFG